MSLESLRLDVEKVQHETECTLAALSLGHGQMERGEYQMSYFCDAVYSLWKTLKEQNDRLKGLVALYAPVAASPSPPR